MPSTNKTENLQLNLWSESDRPMRNDFNSDNTLIDAAVGDHTGNSTIHLTEDEKAWVGEPLTTIMYQGNGEAQRTLELPQKTRVVIVFRSSAPPAVYDPALSCTKIYSAVGSFTSGSSLGLALTTNGAVVTQATTPQDGALASLNESGCQYKIIALRRSTV